MADIFSKTKRSNIMSRVKSKNSKIELCFAKLLRRSKIKFRRQLPLPGKPDFVLLNKKGVIFIDSCFWHGCALHGSLPKTNRIFWEDKIVRNKERDREVSKIYKKMGWRVFRIWEHHLSREEQNLTLIPIRDFLKS